MISTFDLLLLSQIPQIGPHRLCALISHFGDTQTLLSATARELAGVAGIPKKLACAIAASVKPAARAPYCRFAEHQLARVNKCDGRIVTLWENGYPESLKKIYDPPPYLFLRGTVRGDDRQAVAIVGTRGPSEYASEVARQFSRELAGAGITVVSGLARGVDTQAHSAAIEAGGRTFAVTGSGLDVIYPPENNRLYQRIAGHGAVITEYPMGTKPDAPNFPKRNRIISGLTLGTIVIETDLDGGAMITAAAALDQNREVFAVPGLVTNKRARGCHALIRDGRAKLVESIDDVVVEISHRLRAASRPPGRKRAPADLTLFEKLVYEWLSGEPKHVDSIADGTKLSPADTLVSLLGLEFKGLVKQLPGKMFIKRDL
jgi:DNA processing protein